MMNSIYLSMAQTRWGRVTLHVMGILIDHKVTFHSRGIVREFHSSTDFVDPPNNEPGCRQPQDIEG